jgi:hypothetical protein
MTLAQLTVLVEEEREALAAMEVATPCAPTAGNNGYADFAEALEMAGLRFG